MSEPLIVERPEQPYVAVRRRVTLQRFHEIADRMPGLFGWLGQRGVAPAGAPFFRYVTVGDDGQMEVEAGVPVATAVAVEGDIVAGTLPAGRYASVTHVGHPDKLFDVTKQLLNWAAGQGHTWDMSESDDGEHWAARLEILKTNPAEQPDPETWETEVAFKLAAP
ncbi:GyrI-like domain-containing protein [Actinomadura barringtoniae]|uniref:GyrI-like domain-containing protein n=1 Tax=Actinomadura barringtoniae TaxID=1427535 RepID=A0A939PAE4_9ACTN|nr:GyrI-like domain-containing protein [Actinomadura barringtoniae]MBO2448925.1 GyrI-like domain-containing protein [Actinomadura barringtoniae]